VIEEIQQHFEKEYPREGCGIIGIVKGKKRWFPCRNIAEDKDDFIMSSEDYFNVVKKCDVLAIVHSHPDSSNKASNSDIDYCNALGIPYWIFSYPDMELNIVEPKTLKSPLIGREYEFGVQDCFEAMRDYLKSEGIETPETVPVVPLNAIVPLIGEKGASESISRALFPFRYTEASPYKRP
jgi:proteasome lid subunit RPN8/RPN11